MEDDEQFSFDFRKRLGPEAYEGIDRADKHAKEVWKKCFDDCLAVVAKRQAQLTSDDVLAEMQKIPNPPTTHTLSAIGPRMLHAARIGVLLNTNHNLRSQIPVKHGIRHTIWESAIYKPAA